MPSASSPNNPAEDRLTSPHGVRYIAGAGLCAIVSNAILIAVDAVHWPLVAGVLLSGLGGGLTGYAWHARITYASTLTVAAWLRFMSGAMLGIPLAWLALWFFQSVLGWPMWLAAPAATGALFCYHYLNALVSIRWARLRRHLSAKALSRR